MKPNIVALYTSPRKRGEDAFWYPETAASPLFQSLKEAHHFLMRAMVTKGEPPIAVVVEKQGIGLLIANMPTMLMDADERPLLDAYNRALSNTLYLEFGAADIRRVLQAAAALILDYEYGRYESTIKQLFPEQIETIVRQDALEGKTSLTINDVILPEIRTEELPSEISIDAAQSKIAASARKYRKNYAAYLNSLSEPSENPLIFVSTGLAKKEEIQQYASKLQKETLIVLTLSGSIPDKEYLTNEQTAHPRTRLQAVQKWIPFMPKVQQGNRPVVIQPAPTNQQPAKIALQLPPQALEKDSVLTAPKAEEADNTKIQGKAEEKQADLAKTTAVAGAIFLLILGGLFFATRDRTPPQLARLVFHAPDTTTVTSVGESLTIPRVGNQGSFVLTFNEPIRSQNAPRLSINAGQEWATLPQPCQLQNEQTQTKNEQTWNCPITISAENPNSAAALTLTFADGKDRAGNRMTAINVNVSLASANITAALVEEPTIGWHDLLTWQRVVIEAHADYGVAEVRMNNLKAIQDPLLPDLWQAEIPIYPILEDRSPLTVTIKDRYGNTLISEL